MAKRTIKESFSKKIVKFSMDWHRKLGLLFVLPMLVIGLTSIFMAHGKSFGFKDIMFNASWLPAYSEAMMKMEKQEIKSSLLLPGGVQLIGTKGGLFKFAKGEITPVSMLSGMEIKSIANHQDRVFVGTKRGVWVSELDEKWEMLYDKEVHSISVSDNGEIIMATHDDGLMASVDGGQSWNKDVQLAQSLASLPVMAATGASMISLQKLMDDLHTGKALFGKSLEWIWIDVLAVLIIFFTAGGFYFWVWKKQRKAQPKRQVQAKGHKVLLNNLLR